MAVAAVRAGDELVVLPRRACLHVLTRAAGPPAGSASGPAEAIALAGGEEAWAKLSTKARLAGALLHERGLGEASAFHAYVAQLPETFAMPATWTEAERRQLCYPPLERAAARLEATWEAACASVPGVPREEMLWALQAVESRAFSGQLTEGVTELAPRVAAGAGAALVALDALHAGPLVRLAGLAACAALGWYQLSEQAEPPTLNGMMPMVDAVNARSRQGFRFRHRSSDDAFVVCAAEDAEVGEEVFISYGPLSNDALLLRYGYVESGNACDVFEFESLLDAVRATRTEVIAPGLSDAQYADLRARLVGAQLDTSGRLVGDDARRALEEACGGRVGAATALAAAAAAAANELRSADVADGTGALAARRGLAAMFRAEKLRVLEAVCGEQSPSSDGAPQKEGIL